jgi:hypothetical protein
MLTIRKKCLVLRAMLLLCACAGPERTENVRHSISIAEWSSRIDTLPGTYTGLTCASEFADSLVITTDVVERLVWQNNAARGTRVSIARSGNGPGEYEVAACTVRVGRDSLALLSEQQMRIPIISAISGRGRTHTIISHAELRGSQRFGAPTVRYADTVGHMYGAPRTARLRTNSATGRHDVSTIRVLDSIPLVRFSLRDQRADTIFILPRGVHTEPTFRDVDGVRTRPMELGTYGAFNDWFVTADGTLVVADAARSSLLVQHLSKRSVPPLEFVLPHTPVLVKREHWNAHVQRATQGSSTITQKLTSQMFAKAGIPAPSFDKVRYIIPDMPRVLPAFNFDDGKHQMHEADGLLWLPVHIDDDPDTAHWDIIQLKDGKRVGTLALPARHYLVTVTSRGAYVLTVDDDEFERLLLYHPKSRSGSAN